MSLDRSSNKTASSSSTVLSPGPKSFKLPDEVLSMNLDKAELKRQNIIYEIIETEADFVRDLNMMMSVCAGVSRPHS